MDNKNNIEAESEVYVSGVDYESITDGDGVRTTVFISGCKWNCEGCHNKDTHSFTNGVPFTEYIVNDIIKYIKNVPFIRGITLSGGDPMFSAKELIPYVEKIKRELPYVDIWCYTGFEYSELIRDKSRLQLLKMVDVLVDGRFELDKRDVTLKFKGSYNQRIIDVQASLKQGIVIELFK